MFFFFFFFFRKASQLGKGNLKKKKKKLICPLQICCKHMCANHLLKLLFTRKSKWTMQINLCSCAMKFVQILRSPDLKFFCFPLLFVSIIIKRFSFLKRFSFRKRFNLNCLGKYIIFRITVSGFVCFGHWIH